MSKPTDKERADAAEKKIAELVTRQFEQLYQEILADKTMALELKLARIFRAFADLFDSGVPMSTMMPLLERTRFFSKEKEPPVAGETTTAQESPKP